MKKIRTSEIALFLFVGWAFLSLWLSPVHAGVPTQISFQGQLTSNTGEGLPDGTYAMRFFLFDSDSGGAQLWNAPNGEEQNVVVTDGVYQVQLGAIHDLDSSVFDGGVAWLAIEIKNPDTTLWETLSPRQPITATAYALKAGDADTLAGSTVGDLDIRYVQPGEANAVTSAMITDGSVTAADLGSDSVGSSQISTGAVGSSEVATDSLTAADLAAGSVTSSEVLDNSLTAADLAPDSVGASEITAGAVGTSEIADSSVTASNLAADSVGSAEIINGSVTAVDMADGAALAEILDDDGSGSFLNADRLDGLNSSDFALGSHSHFALNAVDGNPVNTLYSDTAGNIGIGTTSPADKLEVQGGNISMDAEEEGGSAFRFRKGGSMMWTIFTAPWLKSDDLRIRNEGGTGDVMTFDKSTGNVGIGLTDPAAKLDVSTSTGTYTVYGKYSSSGTYGYLASNGIGVGGVNGTSSNYGTLGGTSYGVYGMHDKTGNYGYLGSIERGVAGVSNHIGVFGSGANYGMWAQAFSSDGTGLYASGGVNGNAADFRGNVRIFSEADNELVMVLGEGLDYAEGFDVSQASMVKPGSVLVIDPDSKGKLMLSEKAYDTRVAGIVAGANGLGSGVRLGSGQFDYDVALAGRVYCNVDAQDATIEPGDLLTTSQVLGYAMKAKDYNRAHGAILGKAMERLEKGHKGQILVLVTLQ